MCLPGQEVGVEVAGHKDRRVVLRNLRRTAPSMMRAAGLAPMDVAHRLGHS